MSPRLPMNHLDRWAPPFARLALGAAFLSAVASRFGLWQGRFDLGRFRAFIQYTGEVNAFLPAALHPALAWAATAAELSLGIALIATPRPRKAAFGSALLLALFGAAMAISQGIKSPLDYSVFSASAAALLLGLHTPKI
ncbi:MAG TPA: MauE/DoxX family redox-associated membrane protein [Holophagaceae bacterium]|nr:MauE/DoxX family redox-associated membrane protein [Holophagaceae bacterium]